jgi:hypothetical protein
MAAAIAVEKAFEGYRGYGAIPPDPCYHLVAHSVELSLKAVLRLLGKTPKELKKAYGHDLESAYTEALALDPSLELDVETLRRVNACHNDYTYRYIVTGVVDRPNTEELMQLGCDAVALAVSRVPDARRFMIRDAGDAIQSSQFWRGPSLLT